MVDNIQIPNDATEVVKIKVENTSGPLRKLLIQILNKLNDLENRIEKLENGN